MNMYKSFKNFYFYLNLGNETTIISEKLNLKKRKEIVVDFHY